MEVWKAIPFSDGTEVSDSGNVRSPSGRIKPQDIDPEGYKRVSLKFKSKTQHMRVHRLVALTFIPNPQNKPLVNHINGKKDDNRVSNLEWCTHRENSMLAGRKGQLRGGSQKREIIAVNIKTGDEKWFSSQTEAARAIRCDDSEINKCLRGKRKSCHGHRFYYADEYDGDRSFLMSQEGRQLTLFDWLKKAANIS